MQKKSSGIRWILLIAMIMAALALAGCGQADTGAEASQEQKAAEVINYEGATVSYLGPEGTYTQEACTVFFDGQGTYQPYETAGDAAAAVVKGETDYAVIPQENTIGGAVIDNVDTLIAQTDVSVIGEVELPISQNLLVLPGAKLEDIKTVYSHKQGLTQGAGWLKKNLPQAELIEVNSTAEGARMVAEGGDKSCAAIGSAACEEVYGLETLEAAIQENKRNVTRFYVLKKGPAETVQETAETGQDQAAQSQRLAFIATGSAEDLPLLMESMEKEGMSLVAIHDRPEKTELGQYIYLIECEDTDYQAYEKVTEGSAFEFRYLGSFGVK